MDRRCPKELTDYPDVPCEMGKNEVDRSCKDKGIKCPWGVDDKSSNYCLWVWLKNNPGQHKATDIAKLLNVSTQRVGQIFYRAIHNLQKQHLD